MHINGKRTPEVLPYKTQCIGHPRGTPRWKLVTTTFSHPPNEPALTFSRTPAPPPDEQQDDDGLPDEKGITMHKDGRQYKVTLRCTYCRTQYTTRWGAGQEPYQELTDANWQRGRDGSGNKTLQRARCVDYYQGCGGDGNRQVVQGQLALQY